MQTVAFRLPQETIASLSRLAVLLDCSESDVIRGLLPTKRCFEVVALKLFDTRGRLQDVVGRLLVASLREEMATHAVFPMARECLDKLNSERLAGFYFRWRDALAVHQAEPGPLGSVYRFVKTETGTLPRLDVSVPMMLDRLRSPDPSERNQAGYLLTRSIFEGFQVQGETPEDIEHLVWPQFQALILAAVESNDIQAVDQLEQMLTQSPAHAFFPSQFEEPSLEDEPEPAVQEEPA
jgi:hypothetical protein